MRKHDAQGYTPQYDTGTRVLVWEHGRLAAGEVIAVDETYREPLYGIQFNAQRKLMFQGSEIIADQPERAVTLETVLRAVFTGFQAEDSITD